MLMVTLYKDGKPLQVVERQVAAFLAAGWSETDEPVASKQEPKQAPKRRKRQAIEPAATSEGAPNE